MGRHPIPQPAAPQPRRKGRAAAPPQPRETRATRHARAGRILDGLRGAYPRATCALRHTTPLELLVATILSAQCTDKRVNEVTKQLFRKYRSTADYAAAAQETLEQDIRSTGFFRNKARSIRECCRNLTERHKGEVPRTLEELVALPGIGRKTANVILGNAFDTPGIVVDTHVGRIARRLGLTRHADPEKIEADLMQLVPEPEWTIFSHRMIEHGRAVCTARKPACTLCAIAPDCPSKALFTHAPREGPDR